MFLKSLLLSFAAHALLFIAMEFNFSKPTQLGNNDAIRMQNLEFESQKSVHTNKKALLKKTTNLAAQPASENPAKDSVKTTTTSSEGDTNQLILDFYKLLNEKVQFSDSILRQGKTLSATVTIQLPVTDIDSHVKVTVLSGLSELDNYLLTLTKTTLKEFLNHSEHQSLKSAQTVKSIQIPFKIK